MPRVPRAVEPDSNRPPSADVITWSSEMKVESLLRWPVFGIQNYPSLTASLGSKDAEAPTQAGNGMFDLDAEVITGLVGNFLSINHVKNPIFDIDLLWSYVRAIAETGLRWDGPSCLVLLICAVSVISAPINSESCPGPSRNKERLERAEAYFQMAQRRIGMLHHANSLISAQCSFLTAVYLMSTLRIMAAWKAFSQAGTQCVGWLAARGHIQDSMDGHTSEIILHKTTSGDIEQHMEDSLYWSCLKSELELRTELGLPGSSLNEMKYTHLYPSPPSPRQLSSGRMRPDSAAFRERENLETGWFFYLAEIALRRIMNEALSSRYWAGSWYSTPGWWATTGEREFQQYVEKYEVKLETWQNMLPPSMAFPRESSGKIGDTLKAILRSHLVDILDVLYFPAVQAVCCQPIQELTSSVIGIAKKALDNAMYRITISEEGYWVRHQGTWLMLRTCSRSALQLLAVAFRARSESSLSQILPPEWEHSVIKVIGAIEYWEPESPDLTVLLECLRNLTSQLGVEATS
uniref:Transcription factor domain-containing protein n=1 Tax=Bionectria ochroleuca TaxID=29856 RepID=A0A8H7TND1_BIOOC